jgi:hypothetical protein
MMRLKVLESLGFGEADSFGLEGEFFDQKKFTFDNGPVMLILKGWNILLKRDGFNGEWKEIAVHEKLLEGFTRCFDWKSRREA